MSPPDDTTKTASLDAVHRLRLARVRVEVVAGPESGHSHAVGAAGCIVGSGAQCDLRLSDPLVSRRHLELLPREAGLSVTDLESRNGSQYRGAKLGRVLLTQDDAITLGDTTLAVRFDAELLDLPISARSEFGAALGMSSALRHVFLLLEQAAASNVTVLLEGESGTGKDVLALALHEVSPRAEAPLVVVDCAAIPENLMESELFGHERGAFTGAVNAHAGAFERADGGTLFLDEVGELPLGMQPKLLRVLESRSFRRLGGSRQQTVDVRVIAATNRALRQATERGEFRQDLYFRLAVAHIRVPPLRERMDDVLPLAERFLRHLRNDASAKLPGELAQMLLAYSWPGNVRELRNFVERYATFGISPLPGLVPIEAPAATESIPLTGLAALPYHQAKQRLLYEFQRRILPRVIDECGGSIPRAAERLGVPRATVYRMLRNVSPDAEE